MKCFVLALWLKREEVWSTSSDAICDIESFEPKVQSWVQAWSLLPENSAERKRCYIVSKPRLSTNEGLAWSALFFSCITLIAGIAYNFLSFYPNPLSSTTPRCFRHCLSASVYFRQNQYFLLSDNIHKRNKKFCRAFISFLEQSPFPG